MFVFHETTFTPPIRRGQALRLQSCQLAFEGAVIKVEVVVSTNHL